MLSHKHRISKNSFQGLQGLGKSFFGDFLTIRIVKTERSAPPKISVIVSKKVAKNAVSRNRIRRKVYSSLEPLVSRMPNNFFFLIYPKLGALKISVMEIKKDCEAVLRKANLL